MIRKYGRMFFVICILFFTYSDGIAYDPDNVHPQINEIAAKNTSLMISTLKNLGFANGVDSLVNQKEIFRWLREGGIKEDTLLRPFEHFHDPTKAWSNAGLKDSTQGRSSLLWAQNPDQSIVTGDWSWPAARTYYYEALTARDNTVREQKFADTFRALGQVMHLLADVSVPEHTRNDIHVFPWLDNATQSFPQIGSWTYETWSKYHVRDLNTTAVAVDPAIVNMPVASGIIPISNFWDTTPNAGYGGTLLGLAEYNNYNSLSKEAIL